jgi:hypothetical protein
LTGTTPGSSGSRPSKNWVTSGSELVGILDHLEDRQQQDRDRLPEVGRLRDPGEDGVGVAGVGVQVGGLAAH